MLAEDQMRTLGFHDWKSSFDPVANGPYGYTQHIRSFIDGVSACSTDGAMVWTFTHRRHPIARVETTHPLLRACLGSLGLPRFNLRKFPACAAGRQLHRAREGRVFPNPAARGQVMYVEAFADLAVGQIDFRHGNLRAIISPKTGSVAIIWVLGKLNLPWGL